jgi:catechol 2,3-dioxygenase-like lactoylglutathione lyase family enzyme
MSEALAAPEVDPASDVFHMGILVDDLDEAIERYSRVLNLTFGARQSRTLSVTMGSETIETQLDLVYSYQGPPYIELMQATGDTGIWGAHRSPGFHHMGAWVDDLDERVKQLAAQGVNVEAALSREGNVMAVYLQPDDLTGTRLELCGRPSGPWSPPR